ncbi:arginine N-succinyltransferase [Hellea balneolensis]|uniref:arginine N-succinyltransferase n=1 Tax=Hellea balneolensis TaxID=287478 RepID=UPI0004054D36|nr:arginine N-succinyltransferase [Hellea balneolensis]
MLSAVGWGITELKLSAIQDTYLFRPVVTSDAPDLLKLVSQSSGGLSSLQPRLAFLKDYIASSEMSFSGKKPLEDPHKYLLGLFDTRSDRLIGCAAVKTQIGKDSPFINFDIKGDGPDQCLQASSRFTGATEVGSLFLHPDFRADGLGRYLAKVRYLLMASESWRFGDSVIAELRGICGAEGSPLYDHLFEYKLEKSFLEADAEYYDRNPDTLGDIVPIGCIETCEMPLDVKASLGQPHPSGIGAMRLLQREGFIFSGTIDLFDAGPIMSAHRDTIRTIMNAKTGTIIASPSGSQGVPTLIASGKVNNFRAVLTPAKASENGLLVLPEAAHILGAEMGGDVRYWQAEPRRTAAQETLVKAHL